jgi:hypothetical protein
LWLIVNTAGSAAVGALVGHFMRCHSGVCIVFANWKRGLAVGALVGFLNGLQFLK